MCESLAPAKPEAYRSLAPQRSFIANVKEKAYEPLATPIIPYFTDFREERSSGTVIPLRSSDNAGAYLMKLPALC